MRPLLPCTLALAAALPAQWNPVAGQWGKTAPSDLRVMTFNVLDAICSSNTKNSATNNWAACARLVAALRPDVLLLQECGDNNGNGTGGSSDSVANLTAAIGMFLHGGNDTFHSGSPSVTAYVQAWAPGYDLPYVFVSGIGDGFNRNVILSRYPFADLNGDGRATVNDIPMVTADRYAPGGNGGLRGFMFAEIDLPDALYAGDLVLGNAHLKAGGASSSHDLRVTAAKNVAYFVDHFYNGAGGSVPDPHDKIADNPPATAVLDVNTAVVIGGDWNEDEWNNGTVGPADWLARAATFDPSGTDGTDRDGTDMTYEHAQELFSGAFHTYLNSPYKDDYVCWQDSLIAARRAFQFDSGETPAGALPPELGSFTTATSVASDHRPVIVDLLLPAALGCNDAAVDFGFAKAGGDGRFPRFAACGSLAGGGSATLSLSACPPNAPVYALLGIWPTTWNSFGGVLVPQDPIAVGPFATDANGSLTIPLPGGGGPFWIHAQWAIADAAASFGLSFSNALRIDFLP